MTTDSRKHFGYDAESAQARLRVETVRGERIRRINVDAISNHFAVFFVDGRYLRIKYAPITDDDLPAFVRRERVTYGNE